MPKSYKEIPLNEGVIVELASGYSLHVNERTGATFIDSEKHTVHLSEVTQCVFHKEIICALHATLSKCGAIDKKALGEALRLSDTMPFDCLQLLLNLSRRWTPETTNDSGV